MSPPPQPDSNNFPSPALTGMVKTAKAVKSPSIESRVLLLVVAEITMRAARNNQTKTTGAKIINTINNLASAKTALDFYKSQALKKHVKFLKKKQCKIDLKLFKEEAKETSFRTLSEIFKILTSNNYPPRSKKVLNLILSLKKMNFKKSLLACFEI